MYHRCAQICASLESRSGLNFLKHSTIKRLSTSCSNLSYSKYKSDTFAKRHIGPRDHEKTQMVQTLGFKVSN